MAAGVGNHFSGAVLLTNLDDFITPSQQCVKPLNIEKKTGKVGKIKIEDDGSYYEVSMSGEANKLKKAKITLNDCLACSGCITSAESVLISQQSSEELYKVLKQNSAIQKGEQSGDEKLVIVSISPQSRASLAANYKLSLEDTAKKLTAFFKGLGVAYILDTTFSRNFSLIESAQEFLHRYKTANIKQTAFPMLTSACPGWICYAEKTHGSFILPYISTTKSPQQIMGSYVKDFFANLHSKRPSDIYHVTVMPCYDKKLEASRQDFYNDIYNTRDVDCVISTDEVDKMFLKENVLLAEIPAMELDPIYPGDAPHKLVTHAGGGSGGFLNYILRIVSKDLFGKDLKELELKTLRNNDSKEITVTSEDGKELKFAIAYGFRNIQNIVQKIKRGKCPYHFVEIMACPSGCNNGGGQIRAASATQEMAKSTLLQVEELYNSIDLIEPTEVEDVQKLYTEWLGGHDSEKCASMLHTQYHHIEKNTNVLNLKW
ncbi:cytosolic Fe-S cluster assembly factor narfl isoform X2 [Octopus bimaculoides]|uniref:Iron hydrogenase small subunit domain-containing protein n=1 Tax=Octopus bimaculoides TaxID=37653 RepID=A0A0L8GCY9_OCTBM|nr:cytosolic Fe-S cluster assembly factor narfl isoform X2 [Octopus bimaculoides]|eukprot:XP_014782128.1 PREDICTED: cytosolic Fe-S cluster assembly factor narfl-like isoform X2 [Octopus bimaculoides]